MKKRQRKKNAKKAERQQQAYRVGIKKLGRVMADGILFTMQQPSSVCGSAEDWLQWDSTRIGHELAGAAVDRLRFCRCSQWVKE